MLTFVCWRWQPTPGYRSTFSPETVYALRDMIRRHYGKPHRFVCVTDRPDDLPGVETVLLWDDHKDVRSPIGRTYPSCYRRLKVFAPDAGEVFGERIVSIDLDTVIVGDISPVVDRPEDFVIWGESDFARQRFNGSLWMLKTGTRTKVWTEFNPVTSPKVAMQKGCRGSDQGWLSCILSKDEAATWGKSDGVYSYRKDISKWGNKLPTDARIVCFHGKHDPWDYASQQIPWVRAHYPTQVAA